MEIFLAPHFPQTFSSAAQRLKLRKVRLRRLWWYKSVSQKLNLDKPHEIGKLVTPMRYSVVGISHVYRSDWSMYARGLRSPAASTLAEVDAFAPGTAGDYTHEIWSVLDVKRRSVRWWDALNSVLRMTKQIPNSGCSLVAFKQAFEAPPLDAIATLLISRQTSLQQGSHEEAKHLDRLIFRLCVAHAAVDEVGLPFEDLIQLINEWLAFQASTVWPFYPVSAFRECVRAIRQLRPRAGETFSQASEVTRRRTVADALRGKRGVDIALSCQPIYVCACPSGCAHDADAQRARRSLASAMQMLRRAQAAMPMTSSAA